MTAPVGPLKRFYATFGSAHVYVGHYVEILAESVHAARACMIQAHGTEWSQEVYLGDEFTAPGRIRDRFGLKRLATVQQQSMQRSGRLIFAARREKQHA